VRLTPEQQREEIRSAAEARRESDERNERRRAAAINVRTRIPAALEALRLAGNPGLMERRV
jgi:hypothetical protein